LANRRIQRGKELSDYLRAMSEDVTKLNNRNHVTSIAANAIGSNEIGEDIVLDNKSISSLNYLPGVSGWRIDGYGNSEFANVYVRGNINAYSGTIGYWNISQPLVKRTFGDYVIQGTLIESSNIGLTDDNVTSGTYVGLFKSYIDDQIDIISISRDSEIAEVTVADHNYSIGDYVKVRVYEDSTFNTDSSVIIDISGNTYKYHSVGPDTVIPEVNGFSILAIRDIAGLYLRDYSKSEFDYGYFSNTGVAYVSAEDVNLVKNPSFEYLTLYASRISSDLSWTTSSGYTFALEQFNDGTNPQYQYDSSYGASITWDSPAPSTYISGTLDYAVGSTYNLYRSGRILYLGMNIFPKYNAYASTPTSVARQIVTGTFTSASSTTTQITYTGTGLNFVVGQRLKVTGFGDSAHNITNVKITSASSTTVVVTRNGAAVATSTGTGSASVLVWKVTTSTDHYLDAYDTALLDFEGNKYDSLYGEYFDYVPRMISTGVYVRTYSVLAYPSRTRSSGNYTFYVSSDNYVDEVNGAGSPVSMTSLDPIGTNPDVATDPYGFTRPVQVYKVVNAAYDISQVRFRFGNGSTVAISDVASIATKSQWNSGINKYYISDSTLYANGYRDATRGLPYMYKSDAIIIDSNLLDYSYSILDETNHALGTDISIDIPAWFYTHDGAGTVVDSTTKFEMNAISNGIGFILDNVYLSTSNKIFYGDVLSTNRWYSDTVEIPTYNPSQASIEGTKKWLNIDLDTQTAYLNYFNYIGFKPSNFSKTMFLNPSLGTSGTNALKILKPTDYETTALSSGEYQYVDNAENYQNLSAYLNLTSGDREAGFELVSSKKEHLITTSTVLFENYALIAGYYDKYNLRSVIQASADRFAISANGLEGKFDRFWVDNLGIGGSLKNSLTLTADSGTNDGTDRYKFNNYSSQSLNFVGSSTITITKTAGTWTFSASGAVSGYIGTTAVQASSAAQGMTGISSISSLSAITITSAGGSATSLYSGSSSSVSGNTGNINITTGGLTNTNASGTTGSIYINAGDLTGAFATGTPGSINIGNTTLNINIGYTGGASTINIPGTVNIGTSSITTTINGNLNLASGSVLRLNGATILDTNAPKSIARLMGYTSTVTSGTAYVLSNTSSYYQQFTGSTAQTITLPVTSTLITGWTFHLVNNNSAGNLTVNSSGGNLVITVPPNTTAMVTCIGTTLTTAADWESGITDFSTYTGTGNVVMSSSPTLSSPVISTITNTGTLTLPTATGTLALNPTTAKGDLIYASATGTPGTLAALAVPGTNGYVLTYNSTSGLPEWAAAASGGSLGYVGQTQTTSSGTNMAITGITSITGPTGTTAIALNSAAVTGAASGAINVITGATTTSGTTGAVTLRSGNSAAASGAVTISTGTATAPANGGALTLSTGNGSGIGSTSGAISILTGNAGSTGNSGAITIDVGTFSTGSAGTIGIGTTNEAASITIGKASSTKVITLNGTVNYAGTTSSIQLNGSAGTSGQVLTSAGAGATPTWTTVSGGSFTGGVLTSSLTLRLGGVGTAGTGPLYFDSTSGATNILTTPVAGAVEYDGTAFYKTPNATTGRAVDVASYYYVSDGSYAADFSITATAKSIFGSATTGLVLVAGTTYEFELNVTTSVTAVGSASTAKSHSFLLTTVSGSPTTTIYQQISIATNTTSLATASTPTTRTITSNATVTVIAAATAGTSRYSIYNVKGIIRVTGTGSVKISPAATATGVDPDYSFLVGAGSYIKITPIGNGTVAGVGTWA